VKQHRYKIILTGYWRHRKWNPDREPNGEAVVMTDETNAAPCWMYPLDGGPVNPIPKGTLGAIIKRKTAQYLSTVGQPAESFDPTRSFSEMQEEAGQVPLGAENAKRDSLRYKTKPKRIVRKSASSSSDDAGLGD